MLDTGDGCTMQEQERCLQDCHASSLATVARISATSCALGEEVSFGKAKHCHRTCNDDTDCEAAEVWKLTGELTWRCQHFSCSTAEDAAVWRDDPLVRAYLTYAKSCPEPGCGASPAAAADRIRRRALDEGEGSGAVVNPDHAWHGAKPNIVFLFADDLGVGDVGVKQFQDADPEVTRYNTLSTPSLQRMADGGMSFLRAYSPDSVCLPSRHAMLVGRHTGRTSVRGNAGTSTGIDLPFLANDTTLASVLQGEGYKTYAIGKWGMGDHAAASHPLDKGFDGFFGQLSHTDAHACFPTVVHDNAAAAATEEDRFGANFQLPRNAVANKRTCDLSSAGVGAARTEAEGTVCDFAQDVFTDRALAYMEERAEKKDGPFFLYVAWTIPHVCSWSNSSEGAQVKVAPYMDRACLDDLVKVPKAVGDRGVREEECRHQSLMENYIDSDVGRVLDAVDQSPELSGNTLVIFAGDNGPERHAVNRRLSTNRANGWTVLHSIKTFASTNGMRGHKRQLYEGSLRTPMIAYWPGRVAPNSTSLMRTSLYDLYGTFADLAGVAAADIDSADLDAISLVPTLSDSGEQVPHSHMYFEYCHRQLHNWKALRRSPNKFCSWAVIDHDWKLVYDYTLRSYQLFDLDVDPTERRNLYRKKAKSKRPLAIARRRQQNFMFCLRDEDHVPLADLFSPSTRT